MKVSAISLTIGFGVIAVFASFGWNGWLVVPVTLLLHMPLFLAVAHPGVGWICPGFLRAGPGVGRVVALTFDDGPSPTVTADVLDVLKRQGAIATFFCIGRAVRRRPELAARIAAEGHELGNHSYLHPRNIYCWDERAVRRDADLAQRVIHRAAGVWPVAYRPPVGFRSLGMAAALRSCGLRMVLYSARAFEATGPSADRIVSRIMRQVTPGAVVLLHDGHDLDAAPDRRALLAALPVLIDRLAAAGYSFVTVSELMDQVPNSTACVLNADISIDGVGVTR